MIKHLIPGKRYRFVTVTGSEVVGSVQTLDMAHNVVKVDYGPGFTYLNAAYIVEARSFE